MAETLDYVISFRELSRRRDGILGVGIWQGGFAILKPEVSWDRANCSGTFRLASQSGQRTLHRQLPQTRKLLKYHWHLPTLHAQVRRHHSLLSTVRWLVVWHICYVQIDNLSQAKDPQALSALMLQDDGPEGWCVFSRDSSNRRRFVRMQPDGKSLPSMHCMGQQAFMSYRVS